MDRDIRIIKRIKKKSYKIVDNKLIFTYYKESYAYVYKRQWKRIIDMMKRRYLLELDYIE